jgi:hypothetical protein
MDRIKLQNGLIAFGGRKGEGKTRFALKLANHLAKTEKVLYLSYQDYSEKLQKKLTVTDGQVHPNLELNTAFDYFCLKTMIEISEYVKLKQFTTLIIDDLECFNQFNAFDSFTSYPNTNTDPLLFFTNMLKIRVIVLVNITAEYNTDATPRPQIRHFIWSRTQINNAVQILALYRPALHGLLHDEDGNSLSEIVEVHELKNEECEERVIVFGN